jgi:alanine dehydrogenase
LLSFQIGGIIKIWNKKFYCLKEECVVIIGVPKEVKSNENRVGLTPNGAGVLAKKGHLVIVEKSAGSGSGFSDEEYINAGALIVADASKVYNDAEVIVKVKEPIKNEYKYLMEKHVIFTYLHLAADKRLVEELLLKKVTSLGYETVQLENGYLPLLAPMSEIAGRMAVQTGAMLLQKNYGGSGVLLSGVPGVVAGEVLILGGGTVGKNAAKIAIGLGARVTVVDVDALKLRELEDVFGSAIDTIIYNTHSVMECIRRADLMIGAVLVPGGAAPKIITEDMVKAMKNGSVIVDVAIDQGGCIETIDRATTYDKPAYIKHGVLHCSISNIPGAVPKTSTLALEAATLPYILEICQKGIEGSLKGNNALLKGLNTCRGKLTCRAVADTFDLEYTDAMTAVEDAF